MNFELQHLSQIATGLVVTTGAVLATQLPSTAQIESPTVSKKPAEVSKSASPEQSIAPEYRLDPSRPLIWIVNQQTSELIGLQDGKVSFKYSIGTGKAGLKIKEGVYCLQVDKRAKEVTFTNWGTTVPNWTPLGTINPLTGKCDDFMHRGGNGTLGKVGFHGYPHGQTRGHVSNGCLRLDTEVDKWVLDISPKVSFVFVTRSTENATTATLFYTKLQSQQFQVAKPVPE
jgi:lipoprotein-anchoring transpeptidase ErfK/SrfK